MTGDYDFGEPGTPRFDAVRELVSHVEKTVALPSVFEDDSQPLLIRQACLETFLLTARTMAHFFECVAGAQVRKGDMVATHFVSTWTPPPERAARLDALSGEVNKQIAHFTVLRIGDGQATGATDLLFSAERVREIVTDVAAMWNRFAAQTKMPPVGVLRVWHSDASGELLTRAGVDGVGGDRGCASRA